MRRKLVSISAVFALVLGLQVEGGGVQSESDMVGRMHRLFYLFSLQVSGQCDRVCALERQARSYNRPLQVIGVVRASGSSGEERRSLEDFRRRHALSYPLVTVAAALDDPAIPPVVKERLATSEEYFLLFDQDGRPVASGTGEELHQLFRAFAPVSTDIDESTWGKIKELFQ